MAEVALAAEKRQNHGSGPTRRLRKEGRVPATLYGHGIDPLSLSVDGRDFRNAINAAGVNAIFELGLDGKKHLAFTRSLQRHPVRGTVIHADFQVVSRNEKISAEVHINFLGEAEQVTKQGGVVEHQLTSLHVTAPVGDFPSHLDLDISGLELDGALRVHDIVLPKNVETDVDGEEPVVVGRLSRAAIEAEEGEGTEEGADAEAGEKAEAAESSDSAEGESSDKD
jgi:large subunit ribosomal protein L25